MIRSVLVLGSQLEDMKMWLRRGQFGGGAPTILPFLQPLSTLLRLLSIMANLGEITEEL